MLKRGSAPSRPGLATLLFHTGTHQYAMDIYPLFIALFYSFKHTVHQHCMCACALYMYRICYTPSMHIPSFLLKLSPLSKTTCLNQTHRRPSCFSHVSCSSIRIGCPYTIRLATTRDRQQLVVKRIVNSHNHEVSKVWMLILSDSERILCPNFWTSISQRDFCFTPTFY